MKDDEQRAANVRFVRLATLALMSLLLEKRPLWYTAPARKRQDGICGLGLVPRDLRRFWPKVTVTGAGCWEWRGYIKPNGYGWFRVGDHVRLAHRVSYEFFNGILPEGLTLDHLCFNKRCVNPDHLEAVTIAENARRYREAIESAA